MPVKYQSKIIACSAFILFIIVSVVINNCMHSNKDQPVTEHKTAIEPITEAEEPAAETRSKKIYMLDGKIHLEIWEYIEKDTYPHIYVQFFDEKYNVGVGSYMKHAQMENGITEFLQDLFERFYENRGNKERGKKAWEEFLQKDGLQLCMNFVNKTEIQPAERRTKIISVLGGEIKLELKEGDDDFPCIGMQFSDKSLNMGSGTYMEIKKRGNFYLMREYNGKKYTQMKDGIMDELQELFESFYERRGDKERCKKAWEAFVKEGGLQEFIDFANEIIDDNFLYSPFNDKYG